MTSPFQQLLRQAAANHADRPALQCGERRLSHAQLADQVARVASGLRAAGIAPGERVALLSGNGLEAMLVLLACAWNGTVAVPINTRLSQAEVEAILDDCGARALAAQAPWLDWGPAAMKRIALDDATTMQALRAHAPAAATAVDADAPLCLIYTAATQGRPKGGVITHANLQASTAQLAQAWSLTADDAALGTLPLFHIAGLSLYAALLACGGGVVLMPRFDALEAARHIHEGRANVMGSFTPMMEQMLDGAAQAGLSLARLKAAFGLEPPAITDRLAQAAPGAVFYASYGQTETGGLVTTAPLRECPGSAGRAMHLSEVRVVDELGQDRPAGEAGLIVVRGPTVSPGYWGHPAPDTPISRLGWHETGDLGALDAQGVLWFRGPAPQKRLIKSGGENVYPAEVEQALRTHPGVADAVVVGVPDPQWGEAVAALCVGRPGACPDAQALADHVGERVARYKRPRRIRFVDALPRDAQGTPDLSAARTLLEQAA